MKNRTKQPEKQGFPKTVGTGVDMTAEIFMPSMIFLIIGPHHHISVGSCPIICSWLMKPGSSLDLPVMGERSDISFMTAAFYKQKDYCF